MQRAHVLVLAPMIVALASCRRQPPDAGVPGAESRTAVVEIATRGR